MAKDEEVWEIKKIVQVAFDGHAHLQLRVMIVLLPKCVLAVCDYLEKRASHKAMKAAAATPFTSLSHSFSLYLPHSLFAIY